MPFPILEKENFRPRFVCDGLWLVQIEPWREWARVWQVSARAGHERERAGVCARRSRARASLGLGRDRIPLGADSRSLGLCGPGSGPWQFRSGCVRVALWVRARWGLGGCKTLIFPCKYAVFQDRTLEAENREWWPA